MYPEQKRIFEVATILTAIILVCCLVAGCSGGDEFTTAMAPTPAGTDAAVVTTTGGSYQTPVGTGGATGETTTTGGTAATLAATGGHPNTNPATGGNAAVTGGAAATGGSTAAATGGAATTGGSTAAATGGAATTGGGPAGYGTAAGCYPGATCTGPIGCSAIISGVTQNLVCCNGKVDLVASDQCAQCVPIKVADATTQPSFDDCAKFAKRPWTTCTTAPAPDCHLLGGGIACC